MYSSQDLERFYFQYQTEALPRGLSLQTFCLKNNVPYNLLHKWYKDTRGKIVEVQLDGVPLSLSVAQSSSVPSVPVPAEGVGKKRLEFSSLPASAPAGCISVDLDLGQGLHVFQKNLDYPGLRRLIEKLEGLC